MCRVKKCLLRREIYKTWPYYKYSYTLFMTNLIKLACFTVIFGLIAYTGLNIFNTLNTYQLERIEAINTILQDS